MKKLICCMGALLLTLSVFGKYGGSFGLDRRNGKHEVGEKVRFFVRWETQIVKSEEFISDGKSRPLSLGSEKPGWAYFGTEVLGDDGKPLKAGSANQWRFAGRGEFRRLI